MSSILNLCMVCATYAINLCRQDDATLDPVPDAAPVPAPAPALSLDRRMVFLFEKFGRPTRESFIFGDEDRQPPGSALSFPGDLGGSCSHINFYTSDIAPPNQLYIGKVGVPGQDYNLKDSITEAKGARMYRELGVKAPRTYAARIPLLGSSRVASILYNGVPSSTPEFGVMSQYMDKMHLLGEAVLQQLHNPDRAEVITVPDPDNPGMRLELKGLMSMLAVANFLGDNDSLGGSGENAGYQVLTSPEGVRYAEIVKIDPGMVGEDFFERRNGIAYKDKDISADSVQTKSQPGAPILIHQLLQVEQDEYRDKLSNLARLSADGLRNMLFTREVEPRIQMVANQVGDLFYQHLNGRSRTLSRMGY